MDLASDFSFQPLPAVQTPVTNPFPEIASPLGPLAGLAGKWVGRGFNVIWRPDSVSGQDRFLELNVTSDQLEFAAISGPIPNRGFLQSDINMFGLTYLQQISDANLKAGLHIEPGLWAAVPKTSDPNVSATVVRLAAIPHGTAVLLQGTASTAATGPSIPNIGIKPFTINQPNQTVDFPEQTLSQQSRFRTAGGGLTGVTPARLHHRQSCPRRGDGEHRLSEGRLAGPERGRGERDRHVLAGDARGADSSHPTAVLADRAAQLQQPELASRHGRHAA
jgi:hypothetical protein